MRVEEAGGEILNVPACSSLDSSRTQLLEPMRRRFLSEFLPRLKHGMGCRVRRRSWGRGRFGGTEREGGKESQRTEKSELHL